MRVKARNMGLLRFIPERYGISLLGSAVCTQVISIACSYAPAHYSLDSLQLASHKTLS
jgi:hypothetical protein